MLTKTGAVSPPTVSYTHLVQVLPEDGALYKIRFSIRKNMVEVMLDTSGDGLHKRGYRKNSMEAPRCV